MPNSDDYLALDDQQLLDQCDVHTYKSSGPGGQHRNKVSSAVRLRHRPTGLSAHGDQSRSQHENKRLAVARLRRTIACRRRRSIDPARTRIPSVVSGCIHAPRGGARDAPRRLAVGRKDRRFWPVAAFLLDVLDAFGGRLADTAAFLGITTGSLTRMLTGDRHLLAAAQAVRKRNGLRPLL